MSLLKHIARARAYPAVVHMENQKELCSCWLELNLMHDMHGDATNTYYNCLFPRNVPGCSCNHWTSVGCCPIFPPPIEGARNFFYTGCICLSLIKKTTSWITWYQLSKFSYFCYGYTCIKVGGGALRRFTETAERFVRLVLLLMAQFLNKSGSTLRMVIQNKRNDP